MDNHSKEVRSYNMSKIRSVDTKPEGMVRKYLFSKGLRYRKAVFILLTLKIVRATIQLLVRGLAINQIVEVG